MSVSRADTILAIVAHPFRRFFQGRFRHDSVAAMRAIVAGSNNDKIEGHLVKHE